MSNNDFLQSISDTVRRIRMQPRVRDVIRERLSAYADLHAVDTVASVISVHSLWTRFHMPILRVGAALMVLAVSTGGLAYASENALPGETLYNVKVGFVEPLESAMLVNPKSRATWHAILAERRLSEAARLEADGRLTPETREQLEARFALHAERASEEADAVIARGDVVAALALRSDLEARLSAHEDIFIGLGEYDDTGAPKNEAAKLHGRIALTREIASALRMRTEAEASVFAFAYGADGIEHTEALTEEVARRAKVAGADTMGAVEERINAARGALAIARTALAENEDNGAYVAAQAATRLSQEAAILSKNRDLLAIGDARIRAKGAAATGLPASAAAKGQGAAATSVVSDPLAFPAIMSTIMSTTSTSTEEEKKSEEDKKEDESHRPTSEDASANTPSQDSKEESIDIEIGPVNISLPSLGL